MLYGRWKRNATYTHMQHARTNETDDVFLCVEGVCCPLRSSLAISISLTILPQLHDCDRVAILRDFVCVRGQRCRDAYRLNESVDNARYGFILWERAHVLLLLSGLEVCRRQRAFSETCINTCVYTC